MILSRYFFPRLRRIILPVLSLLLTHSISFSQADTCVHLDFEAVSGNKGDEVCIKVKVSNFKDIVGFQFPINFDPRVMIPTGASSFANLVGFGDPSVNFDTLRGAIRVIWTNVNSDTSNLPDGSLLFIVCFKLIGAPGDCTKLIFSDRPLITEFIRRFPVDNDIPVCVIDDNPNDEVCIGQPNDLCVISYVCGTTTSTGTITIKAWGGREPYRVESSDTKPSTDAIINNSGDCVIINNQTPGTYKFKVTDGRGKDTMFNVIIENKPEIVVTRDDGFIRNPTCWYSSNGRIRINVSGGSGTTFIKWLPINTYGNPTITSLKAGKYTAVVSDSNGCVVTRDIELRADSMYAQITIDKAASCSGKCDGKVTVKAFGGTPIFPRKYEYAWSIGGISKDCMADTTCTNDTLCGNQFVVIRDANKCEDTIYFSIPNASELKNQISIDSIKCKGDSARIRASLFSSGTINTPISFDLRDVSNTSIPGGSTTGTSYISNLIRPGRYYLYTTDNIGCIIIDTILIVEPPPLQLLENQLDTIESCSPGGDALIDVRGLDGTTPYKYIWSNGASSNRVDTFRAGTYTVTITDYNNCTTSKSYNIIGPKGPVITSLTITDIPCIGEKTGCVEVIYTQGSTPVTFKWSVPGNTAKICNLDTGTYTVTLTDQSGCADTVSATVNVGNGGIIIDSVVIMNPSCPGNSDGLIIVFARGGSGQLSYGWSNNSSSPVNTSLKAGRYIVSIDDIGGCPPVRDTFDLVDRPKPSITVNTILGISCTETSSCDATAFVTVNTSDTIVVATWSSGEQNRYISQSGVFTDTAKNLCSGPQFVIISVDDLCSDTIFFNVSVPPRISLDTPKLILSKPTCYGRSDGSITVAAKGGCSPFTYDWVNPVASGPTISQLRDGYYKVKITDCRGCVHFDSVRLRQPDTIRVQIISGSSFDVSCPEKKDGRITLAWNGGSGGNAQFNWSPNVGKDSVLLNLGAGTYSVTITDKNNCTGVASFDVNEPPPIEFLLSAIDTPKCTNDKADFSVLQAAGGTGPKYEWTLDDGAPFSTGDVVPLFSGSYKLVVYDRNGCSKDTNIIVPDPIGDIDLDFGIDIDTIQLGDSIRLIGVITAQSQIDSFLWNPALYVTNPNSSDSYVRPDVTTTFMLTVVDENGCRATDKVQIIVENIRRFFAPNILSPNGDNTNDILEFTIGPDVENVDLVEVYDRWGGRLYQTTNPTISGNNVRTWNGRSHDEPVNPGVYIYIAKVRFKDGFVLVYRGDLTVVR